MTLHSYLYLILLPILAVSVLLLFIRFLIGPNIVDKVIALDLLITTCIGIIAIYSIVYNQPTFLDIGHVLSTKGRALSLLAKHLCISLKDVIAIGDQENDISMIEAAGIGIAMGDGQEMLKKKADYITSPFHENGFTKAINDLLLAKKQRNT